MRIYNLFPLLAGPVRRWTPHLERAADLGFDWIFVNPIQKLGRSGSLYSIKDYFRINPALVTSRSAVPPEDQVRDMARTAEKLGLRLMIDLVINHCAYDSPLLKEHPEWFAKEGRRIAHPFCLHDGEKIVWRDLARFDHSRTRDPEGLFQYCKKIVEYLIGLGFTGLRCDAAYQIPGAFWKRLIEEVRRRPEIAVFTNAELISKSGSFGNYKVEIKISGEKSMGLALDVGSIVVATGFDTYQPEVGEYGYGIDGVVTLPKFKQMVDSAKGELVYHGRPVKNIAYIYCVGSRQPEGNAYCSRYCCAATVHASLEVADVDPSIHQYHLYRDIRTYGKFELMYTQSRERGSVYMKYPEETPPSVSRRSSGQLTVTTHDLLTGGEELEIPVDLVVLVTGMVPRKNETLTSALKLPVGSDGFYNEIHPKLRPVETVVDGVMIAGACQGPKTSAEAVTQALAAVTQSAAILKKGYTEMEPLVAVVDADACTACGDCLTTCPYEAIKMTEEGERRFAVIDAASCKGCGGCVSYCPENAIDLLGYTDDEISEMIADMIEVRV